MLVPMGELQTPLMLAGLGDGDPALWGAVLAATVAVFIAALSGRRR
jgi:hypothetical protein